MLDPQETDSDSPVPQLLMTTTTEVDPAGSLAAWRPLSQAILQAFDDQLRFDRAAIWLVQPERPAPDELLAQRGLGPETVLNWCNGGHRRSRLVEDALIAGRAVGTLHDAELSASSADATDHTIAHALPESHPQHHWWLAILGRHDLPFTQAERQSVDLVLRQIQTQLNHTDNPGVCQALVGHDDRPISTDLGFHQTTTRLGLPARELLGQIRSIREQRFKTIHDNTTHDLILEINNETFWVVFRKTRAIELEQAAQWIVELRPVSSPSPPAVGVLSNERIARAIGYIHDSFAKNPSLQSMAAYVHVSPFHFHRVFTKLVGVSPKRYLQLKQLQIACRLLRDTHTSIHDISRLTGFTSHGHFNATFRRLVGCSPTQHRAGRKAIDLC